jgi:hypothetical protein
MDYLKVVSHLVQDFFDTQAVRGIQVQNDVWVGTSSLSYGQHRTSLDPLTQRHLVRVLKVSQSVGSSVGSIRTETGFIMNQESES